MINLLLMELWAQIVLYVALGLLLVLVVVVFAIVPTKTWFIALVSGAHVSMSRLIGMKMYYKQQNENVETIGDECSRVGREIGTRSKCKTEIEEIVQST